MTYLKHNFGDDVSYFQIHNQGGNLFVRQVDSVPTREHTVSIVDRMTININGNPYALFKQGPYTWTLVPNPSSCL